MIIDIVLAKTSAEERKNTTQIMYGGKGSEIKKEFSECLVWIFWLQYCRRILVEPKFYFSGRNIIDLSFHKILLSPPIQRE